jgi:DnaJ-class molecular chaperone
MASIGIDLGTSNSAAAVLRGGRPVIIPSAEGISLGQPDTVFCVRGKGLPEFGGSRHGDLYLRVQIHIPEHLAPAERELYERLRTLGKRRQ